MAASEDEPVLNIFIPTQSSRQPQQVKLTAREKASVFLYDLLPYWH